MKNIMIPATLGIAIAVAIPLAKPASVEAQDIQQLRWATSAVGSAGHRAKVSLMAMLNREMPDYSITVLPTAGAAATIRGFATGQFDGYYGADVAFHEIADDSGRFEGFRDQIENELLQSFWAFTLEVGLGVRAADRDDYEGWRDLAGAPVFTGPAPWDVRAALERPMRLLEVGHEYVELDTGLAGTSLTDGTIDAFIIYTAGGASPAPWVSEAMLAANVVALNPSDEEIALLTERGVRTIDVEADVFETDIGTDAAKLVPFYYGFHVGLNVPEDDVYRMLTLIEEHSSELAQADPGLSQIRDDMIALQVGGIESTGDAVRIHPGLARFLREKDAWNDDWDGRVAE